MHDDCELCYSRDYCKLICQMAARYTLVDFGNYSEKSDNFV